MRVHVETRVIAATAEDGTLVVLSERTGRLHQSNRTGAALWRALVARAGDPDQAAAEVADLCQIDVERVRSDLTQFIVQLRDAGLVRIGS